MQVVAPNEKIRSLIEGHLFGLIVAQVILAHIFVAFHICIKLSTVPSDSVPSIGLVVFDSERSVPVVGQLVENTVQPLRGTVDIYTELTVRVLN